MSTIEFKFNEEKSIEAILHVLNQRPSLNFYNLMKIIFEADKSHLIQYGRPVTGDFFVAMQYGTVPSHVYDMFKNSGSDNDLWTKDEKNITWAKRLPNKDLLSESDIEALESGVEKYADLSFDEVYNLNHQEECWRSTRKDQVIPFEKIIEDSQLVDELKNTGLKVVI